jgi:hypothetical protein
MQRESFGSKEGSPLPQIWRDYVEVVEEVKAEEEKVERKVELKTVVVTEVTPELKVYVQFTSDVSLGTISIYSSIIYHIY